MGREGGEITQPHPSTTKGHSEREEECFASEFSPPKDDSQIEGESLVWRRNSDALRIPFHFCPPARPSVCKNLSECSPLAPPLQTWKAPPRPSKTSSAAVATTNCVCGQPRDPSEPNLNCSFPTKESSDFPTLTHNKCSISPAKAALRKEQGTDLIDLRRPLEGVIFGMDPFGGLGGCHGLRYGRIVSFLKQGGKPT